MARRMSAAAIAMATIAAAATDRINTPIGWKLRFKTRKATSRKTSASAREANRMSSAAKGLLHSGRTIARAVENTASMVVPRSSCRS